MKNKLKIISSKKTFSFKYSFDIASLTEDWLQASGNNIYLNPNYLKALEQSIKSNIVFIYVVIYSENLPVGVVYFQWIQVKDSFFSQKKIPKEISKKSLYFLFKRLNGGLLLCGNFFATGNHGFYFREHQPGVDILEQLIKKIKDILAKKHKKPSVQFIMFKEFEKDSELNIQKQLSHTTACFQIDVNMVLVLNAKWLSFEDYLNSMTTKYRTRAKSVLNKTSALVLKEFSQEDILLYQNEINILYDSILNRVAFNMTRLSGTSFYLLKKQLQDLFVFTGFFYEDKLIAFSSACINNSYLDANYVGIDPSFNKKSPIYQRVLYEYVMLSIRKNVKELRLGRTAETMKSSLGAKPKEMNLYIKHTSSILHMVLKPLLLYVKPSVYELRSPFKKIHSKN